MSLSRTYIEALVYSGTVGETEQLRKILEADSSSLPYLDISEDELLILVLRTVRALYNGQLWLAEQLDDLKAKVS